MVWLWLLACAEVEPGSSARPPEASDAPEAPEAELALEIGAGAEGWEPLAPGDPVVVVGGPQGAWHVDVAGHVANASQEVAVEPVLTWLDGSPVSGSSVAYVALADYDDPSASGEFFGVRAFLGDADAVCGELDGQALLLTVTVSDLVDGCSVTETLEVVAALDESALYLCE